MNLTEKPYGNTIWSRFTCSIFGHLNLWDNQVWDNKLGINVYVCLRCGITDIGEWV